MERDSSPPTMDTIVVGAGSAGCALAYELAKSGQTVFMIEPGSSDRSPSIKLPAAVLHAMVKHDWEYRSAPDPTRRQRSEQWFRGRVVGGSSSINGMIYVRGGRCDYDRWLRMGNEGWGSDDVMPLFRSIERCDRRSIPDPNHLRGREGPLRIRMVQHCHLLTGVFVQAAQGTGCKFNEDYNGALHEGAGYTQLTQRGRRRWSAADAFLRPLQAKRSVELVTCAHAEKILIKERRAVGVRFERGGHQFEARARDIILSAGAINTPKLLMLSGIGDRAALARLGIELMLERKSVGQGLMEHPLVRLIYRMSVATRNPRDSLIHKARLLAKYLLKGQGLLASIFEAMVFLKTSPLEVEPDVQLHFAPLGIDAPTDGERLRMLPYPSVMISVKCNHPASRGRVTLTDADPKAPPLIEPQLLADDGDVARLVRGVSAVRRIMTTSPIAQFVAEEVRPGVGFTSAASIGHYIRDHATVAYHPVGTCRMGADDGAVVTPRLQVRGIENLWIADASIIPEHISGNTNVVCMMIGAKLGRQLSSTTPL